MTTITCPNGHRFRTKPIAFGLPTEEAMERAERGELLLAGCTPDVPYQVRCPRCGAIAEWASQWASGGPPGGSEGPQKSRSERDNVSAGE
jgi:hypothetical protein